MKIHSLPTRAAACIATLSMCSALSAQAATYSVFGAGCAGSTLATPRLSHNDFPVTGSTFQVDLFDALPFSFGLLVTGQNVNPVPISLAFLGMPGCDLLVSPDFINLVAIDANGSAGFPIVVPNIPTLAGVPLDQQWMVLDPLANAFGMVASNGGFGAVGTSLPQLGIANVQVLAGGDVVLATMTNVGSNPLDLCARQTDANGDVSLFLPAAVLPGPTPGQMVVELHRELGPAAGQNAPIGFMRGLSSPVPFVSTPRLSAPQRAWVWHNDRGLVEDATATPGQINSPGGKPSCPAGHAFYGSVGQNASGSLVIKLPMMICAPLTSIYPTDTKITIDFHGDTSCGEHYDMFFDTINVLSPTIYLQAAIELSTSGSVFPPVQKGQIPTALDAAYPNIFSVTYDIGTNEIRLSLLDPNCHWIGGGGTVHVCCP